MRVILKPAGLFFIIAAFALLAALAVGRNRKPAPPMTATTAAPVTSPAPTNAAAVKAAADAARATPAPAASRAPLPPGVLLMPDIAADDWKSLTAQGKSSVKIVPADVPGHPHARRITIDAIGDQHWDIQVAHTLDAPFKKGQKIRLTFWGRSKDSCPIAATVEQSDPPYDKIVYREVKLTPEWKQFSEEWVQQTDTPSGWAKVDFQVGYKVGEIELTGVIIRLVK